MRKGRWLVISDKIKSSSTRKRKEGKQDLFGTILKKFRKSKKLYQQELADRYRTHKDSAGRGTKQMISRLERGDDAVSEKTVRILAGRYGASVFRPVFDFLPQVVIYPTSSTSYLHPYPHILPHIMVVRVRSFLFVISSTFHQHSISRSTHCAFSNKYFFKNDASWIGGRVKRWCKMDHWQMSSWLSSLRTLSLVHSDTIENSFLFYTIR